MPPPPDGSLARAQGRLWHLLRLCQLDGVVVSNDEGVPQGGPLSPLLINVVLDELDRELGRRGHRFVRYVDAANIYVRSVERDSE